MADQGAQTPSVPAPDHGEDQGGPTSSVLVPRPTQRQPAASTVSSLRRLQADLTALQLDFQEEKELNAKRHVDLLALLTALQPKPLAP